MGLMPGTSITESRPLVPVVAWGGGDLSASAGRMAMRVISLLALAGAVASALPGRAEASALTPRWSGAVTTDGAALPGITLTAVCGTGTSEQRVAAVSDHSGRFSIDLPDGPCRGYVAVPPDHALADQATASRIVLAASGSLAQVGHASTSVGQSAVTADGLGVLVAQVLSVGAASDEHLRSTLSLVVLALIAVIAGSLLVGLHRPRRDATA
jgi:hypothetical protein